MTSQMERPRGEEGERAREGEGEKVREEAERAVQVGEEEEVEYSCCHGRFYNIPERKRAIMTLLVLQIAVILHEILHLSWFSVRHNFLLIALFLIAHFTNLYTFLVITTRQPGIIQRIHEKYEVELACVDIPKDQHIRNHVGFSYLVQSGKQLSRIKFCLTCNVYRPPRANHCDECGVCIEKRDHHCQWLGTCIGKRNYNYFYMFLFSLVWVLVLIVSMCIQIMAQTPTPIATTLGTYPFSIILTILALPPLCLIVVFFSFHTYLLLANLTTKEYLENRWDHPAGNPYAKSNCIKNAFKLFFTAKRPLNYKVKPHYPVESDSSSHSEARGSNKKSSDEHNEANPPQPEYSNNVTSVESIIHAKFNSIRKEESHMENVEDNIKQRKRQMQGKRNALGLEQLRNQENMKPTKESAPQRDSNDH